MLASAALAQSEKKGRNGLRTRSGRVGHSGEGEERKLKVEVKVEVR